LENLNSNSIQCSLCHSKAIWFCEFFREPIDFYKCQNCKSIFKDKTSYPDFEFEKQRYLTHNNNVEDRDYQAFVSPITDAVVEYYSNDKTGLDYGCGTGPVAAHVLKLKGYNIVLYDPFFYPDNNYHELSYDFIICCEVMEHFHKPDQDFKQLRSLLKNDGRLFCKTSLISDHISVQEFKDWHYKNDPTHVFFYSPSALEYIKTSLGFHSLDFDKKLITFKA
jgi:2-polyprenyl-3-methyl-5-hydroxy-6-metoxy-1,4-benzoquinol methylase